MLLQVEIDRRWLLVGCSRVSAAGLGPPCPKGWGRTVADLAHREYDVRGLSLPAREILWTSEKPSSTLHRNVTAN